MNKNNCNGCNGTGFFKGSSTELCRKCYGVRELNWIERIFGKDDMFYYREIHDRFVYLYSIYLDKTQTTISGKEIDIKAMEEFLNKDLQDDFIFNLKLSIDKNETVHYEFTRRCSNGE